jgi:hypothetical protein
MLTNIIGVADCWFSDQIYFFPEIIKLYEHSTNNISLHFISCLLQNFSFKWTIILIFTNQFDNIGCVRLLVRTILILYGPVRSKQTVRAVPVPHCGPTVG